MPQNYPFSLFYFGVSLLKLKIKKGTLTTGVLGNLGKEDRVGYSLARSTRGIQQEDLFWVGRGCLRSIPLAVIALRYAVRGL